MRSIQNNYLYTATTMANIECDLVYDVNVAMSTAEKTRGYIKQMMVEYDVGLRPASEYLPFLYI